ncbi:hypothetical protein VB773_10395 [Haloarculaceae archaeon H-GB2-1]|nr:hypothetical protein [Haloarculaceae archaeon H-GB1-1]MEA5386417.1 hypothetical protein [Haloarculaceae archaeon H-GB11]MEA5407927.1 hypothetical protein [Haloarculaceae archaeon H-GB2-1]
MFNRLMQFLGFEEPSNRPYSDLSDDEIIDRYARARLQLAGDEWNDVGQDVITETNHLMQEWETRHSGLQTLDALAERRERELVEES